MLKIFGNGANKKLIIITGAVVGVLLAVFAGLCIYTSAYGKIYPNVRAGGVALGGKTVEEAKALLDEDFSKRYGEAAIKVKLEDVYERTVTSGELSISFPSEETAQNAYNYGREGGVFSRLGAFLGSHEVETAVKADEAAVGKVLADFTKYDMAPVDASYEISGNKLILHPKTDGKKLDTEKFRNELISRFADENYEDMQISRDVNEAVAIDMDKMYADVHKEASDARIEVKDGKNTIVPHVVGVDFDLAAAKKAYDESNGKAVGISLKITQPKVYTESLEANLFKYCLSEAETHFSPKKVARTTNVRLAAKYLNGKILNPGEEFSYNKTVGPRTKARGFKAAAIFASGEVVDGIGGGICQVSSTLYMAALRANMKITQRKNHTFYVDYAPKGEDATVVYGSIDFRFVNTSPYPIKIVATSQNNYIRIKLMGTKADNYTVKFTKETLSTVAYSTKTKQTASLAKGVKKVEQKGQPGLTMKVYRTVYDANGKKVTSYLENKSTYKPMPEIVLVGTGAAVPSSGEAKPAVKEEKPAEQEPPKEETPKTEEKPAETQEPEKEATASDAEKEGEDAPELIS